MTIPHILHQTYNKENNKYNHFTNNWKRNNKKWKYVFYHDEDIESFINDLKYELDNEFNGIRNILNKCSKIEKIDIFRYLLMYYIGGVYSDIDTNCFKSFDEICLNNDCIFGIESYITIDKKKLYDYQFNYTIGNAILISRPKHPLFKDIIDNIINSKFKVNLDEKETEYIVQKTGPGLITKTIQNHINIDKSKNDKIRHFIYKNNKVQIMEQIYFYPPTKPSIYNIFPFNINIHSNHVCEGSWKLNYNNNYNSIDFIPYPWLWMYNYRFDYLISILSMSPLINTIILLYNNNFKIQSTLICLTLSSAIVYHTNEYLQKEKKEIYHIIDNVTAHTILPIVYLINEYHKDKNIYITNNTIILTLISLVYQYKFYSNTIIELVFTIPFLFFLKEYFYKHYLLSVLSIAFFLLGLQDFDYFSSRKYHSLWHFSASFLIYTIICDILNT